MNKIRLLLFLIIIASNTLGHSQNINSLNVRLDGLYKTFYKEDGAGCAVLISKRDKIIYQKGFGQADIESNVLADPNSLFRIGSITKQFTAVAILQLYQQGKLNLNDDIQKYVPDFPTSSNKITIENLLTHTSGIKNLTDIEGLEIKETTYTAKELIDIFKNKPLDYLPGEKFSYSNSGYILLGYIIEKISGKPYAEYIKSNIFNVLGMKESYYDTPISIIKNRAKGYNLDTAYKLINAPYLNTSFPYSAGGLLMTVGDYFKWHQALWAGKLIKRETFEKALTPFKLNDGTLSKYGYGWFLGNLLGSETLEHGGAINGFTCKETYLPKEDILAVTFSNASFGDVKGLTDQAAALVAGKPQLQEIAVSSSTKKKYIGTYKFSSNDPTTITIYDKGGQLFLKDSNSPSAWQLHFIKENEFICYEVFPNTHIFTKNDKGEIDFLIIKNFDNETKVMRVK